jgi:hypothetical protein
VRTQLLAVVLGISLAEVCLMSAGEVYRVTVTRVDKDLYKIENTRPVVYIETQHCYQYATRDDAILRYERYGTNNKLIFSDDTSCDVKALR